MESRGPGLADHRLDWNLAGWIRLRPVIRMYHGPGQARHGPGQARSARPGLAVPQSRELAPPAKTVRFEISEFLQFENITKRDVFQLFSLLELKCHGS